MSSDVITSTFLYCILQMNLSNTRRIRNANGINSLGQISSNLPSVVYQTCKSPLRRNDTVKPGPQLLSLSRRLTVPKHQIYKRRDMRLPLSHVEFHRTIPSLPLISTKYSVKRAKRQQETHLNRLYKRVDTRQQQLILPSQH